jgi:hypothetical protein
VWILEDSTADSLMLMVVCWCDRVGQIGESGSLRREWWRERHGYFEVLRW